MNLKREIEIELRLRKTVDLMSRNKNAETLSGVSPIGL